MKKRVMVAMSGGVDSSIAAALLKEQGFDVVGATLELYGGEEESAFKGKNDVGDAKRVAEMLHIPHYVFDLEDAFKENVINRFVGGYLNARTPNPCIDCNRYIKFGELMKRADETGCDYLATGHYAITELNEKCGRFFLKKAKDRTKDQTYVLYSLTQEQLKRTIFPLGLYDKKEVREMAARMGLCNAKRPESQDICFVKDGDYAAFIEGYSKTNPISGDFVDKNGRVLGRHAGMIHYTVGQRKGLGISFGRPMYVVSKDREKNTVTLGEEDALFSKSLVAGDINLISIEKLDSQIMVQAKTRYSQTEKPALIRPMDGGKVLVEFETPQRAVTPGQAVVFYDTDSVLGGGTIEK